MEASVSRMSPPHFGAGGVKVGRNLGKPHHRITCAQRGYTTLSLRRTRVLHFEPDTTRNIITRGSGGQYPRFPCREHRQRRARQTHRRPCRDWHMCTCQGGRDLSSPKEPHPPSRRQRRRETGAGKTGRMVLSNHPGIAFTRGHAAACFSTTRAPTRCGSAGAALASPAPPGLAKPSPNVTVSSFEDNGKIVAKRHGAMKVGA